MPLTLIVITAFIVTLTLIPVVIGISKSINVLDQPDSRKIHSKSTPSLGGIAMFIGLSLSLVLAFPFQILSYEKYFLISISLIFLLGVRDDLASLQATHKLLVQLFASILVVFLMDIKIEGLNGLFGVETFGWYFDELFTVFIIAIMTNAFNLIDGIDGLAASVTLFISIVLCILFINIDNLFNAGISLGVVGICLAFLIYNWHPSKIFMGDTGSMMLGFILTVLFVRYLEHPPLPQSSSIQSPLALLIALFIIPIYDTLRVFTIRFFTGRHPLAPDRNHIHHVMLKLGFNHSQATLLLLGFNIILFLTVYQLQSIGEVWLILLVFAIPVFLGGIFGRKVIKREAARTASLQSAKMNISKSA